MSAILCCALVLYEIASPRLALLAVHYISTSASIRFLYHFNVAQTMADSAKKTSRNGEQQTNNMTGLIRRPHFAQHVMPSERVVMRVKEVGQKKIYSQKTLVTAVCATEH